MKNRFRGAMIVVIGIAAAVGQPGAVRAAKAPATAPSTVARATFAGGCFWCEETAFEGLPGVISVTSGYTGGLTRNPTYEEVGSGITGHAESVEVLYDASQTSYAKLLEIFWHNVDPTQANGQFCDHGTQYRSAIFYHDSGQKKLALESRARLKREKQRWSGKVVTQIVPATKFYPAEDYHQDFYKKDPEQYHAYREGCGRDRKLMELWGMPGRSVDRKER